jgi:hypothetical protein
MTGSATKQSSTASQPSQAALDCFACARNDEFHRSRAALFVRAPRFAKAVHERAPKGASAEKRVVRDRSALSQRCRWAGSRRALLLGDALAFRRSSAALAKFSGLAQSGPALHGSDDMRYPGSQLLADLRLGRPGEFPNRPKAACETASGHRARSTFRIASGKRPWTSELIRNVPKTETNVKFGIVYSD